MIEIKCNRAKEKKRKEKKRKEKKRIRKKKSEIGSTIELIIYYFPVFIFFGLIVADGSISLVTNRLPFI